MGKVRRWMLILCAIFMVLGAQSVYADDTQDSLDVLIQRLNDAKQAVQDFSNSVKNVGRALTGKELLEYVPWDPEKGKIASVQRKIYAMERTLGNLQERTNTLLSKMQRPEQKPEKQVKKTTKKVI